MTDKDHAAEVRRSDTVQSENLGSLIVTHSLDGIYRVYGGRAMMVCAAVGASPIKHKYAEDCETLVGMVPVKLIPKLSTMFDGMFTSVIVLEPDGTSSESFYEQKKRR